MILLVDNRDSFTFNVAQRLQELGAEVVVRRAAELDSRAVRALAPQRIVVGPGPGRPEDGGPLDLGLELVRELGPHVPLLGICLGHQTIAHAFGGHIQRSDSPAHGRTVTVHHDSHGLWRGLPNPLTVGRYNSLTVCASSLPPQLEVSARSSEGEVMGLRHTDFPIEGVQFHPDSILTPEGSDLFANFLHAER